jgi:hypothetical protein
VWITLLTSFIKIKFNTRVRRALTARVIGLGRFMPNSGTYQLLGGIIEFLRRGTQT